MSAHSEYQKKAREKTRESGKVVYDYLKQLPDVPASVLEAAAYLGREGGQVASPVFTKLFPTGEVGSTVEALEVYKRTGKGYAEMRQLMRKWAEKGFVVKLDEPTDTYVLEAVNAN